MKSTKASTDLYRKELETWKQVLGTFKKTDNGSAKDRRARESVNARVALLTRMIKKLEKSEDE